MLSSQDMRYGPQGAVAFPRRGERGGRVPMESEHLELEGWCTDPFGRHEARWLSQGTPTKLVRDGGVESYDDPPDEEPTHEPRRDRGSGWRERWTRPVARRGPWERTDRPRILGAPDAGCRL